MAGVRSRSPPPTPSGVIRLRLQGSGDEGEHVALDESNLPHNVYDVTTMLRLETAPRSSWRDVAAAYMRAGFIDNGISVLEQGTSPDVDTMLGEGAGAPPQGSTDYCSRTDLLSALAGACVMAADVPGAPISVRQKLLRKAAGVFSRADLIDSDHPAIWTAKGQAEAAASRPLESKTWFENAHQNGQVPAALGLAAFHLNGAAKNPPDPRKASSLLASALQLAPCPAATWTGLGYALFKAGDVKTARTVLRRAVKALSDAPSTERLEALYALARVESAEPTPLTVENALAALREAYTVCGGHSDPRVLTLLAEIRFLGGDPAGAELFAIRAVEAAEDFLSTVIPSSGAMEMDLTDASDPSSSQLPPAYSAIQRNVRILARSELARARLQIGRVDEATHDYVIVKRLMDEALSEPGGNSGGGGSLAVAVNPGVYLRLGLLKLGSGLAEDLPLAEECLEKVLSTYDDRNAIAMRGLGIIIGRRVLESLVQTEEDGHPPRMRGGESYSRARDLLQRGIDADIDGRKDVPALLVYAALIEEGDPSAALSAYRNAVAAIEETAANLSEDLNGKGGEGGDHAGDAKVPAKVSTDIWNNIVALMARTGNVSEARALFRRKIGDDVVKDNIHLSFNAGRLAEMDHDYEEASSRYTMVLEKDPGYHIAKIRLGCIAMQYDGDFGKAEDLFKSVLVAESPVRMTAAGFLNKLYIERKDPKAQQSLLEANRGECDYMALAFAQFMHSHLDGLGTSDRRNRFLVNHIGTPLQQALRKNKRNAYAANGIGVFFAENAMMSEARDAFSAAGAGGEIARSARVNLAHATVALAKSAVRAQNDKATPGQFFTTAQVPSARGLCQQAEQLYSDAQTLAGAHGIQSKSVVRGRLELLLYRANAKHEIGAFREAADILQQILHVSPDSAPIWFNLGQVLRECASGRAMNKKSLPDMILAKNLLDASRAAFVKAAALDRGALDPVSRTRVDRKFLDAHYKFILQTIKTHDVDLINARNAAEDKEKARIEHIARIEQAKKQRLEAARQREEEERKKQLALEEAAAAAAKKLRISEEEHQKRMQMAKEEDELEDEEGEGGENGSKPKRKRKKKDKNPGEKPPKRRKGRKDEPADGMSSDEYGEEDMVDFTGQTGPQDKEIASRSEEEDGVGEDEDGVVRARGRKRVLIAPDSDNDDDDRESAKQDRDSERKSKDDSSEEGNAEDNTDDAMKDS